MENFHVPITQLPPMIISYVIHRMCQNQNIDVYIVKLTQVQTEFELHHVLHTLILNHLFWRSLQHYEILSMWIHITISIIRIQIVPPLQGDFFMLSLQYIFCGVERQLLFYEPFKPEHEAYFYFWLDYLTFSLLKSTNLFVTVFLNP